MKSCVSTVFAILALLYAFPAAGQDSPEPDGGLYFNFNAIGANPDAKDDPTQTVYELGYGYGATGAIGIAFANPESSADLRFELEGGYRTSEMSWIDDPSMVICGGVLTGCPASGKFDIATAMVNMFIDFHTGSRIVPSVGIGYGRGRFFLRDWVVNGVYWGSSTVDVDIFQLSAGIGYKLSSGLIVDAEYRYLQPNNQNYSGYLSNDILVGFRMIF